MPNVERLADDRVFTIAAFLTPAECAEWIAHAESIGFAFATVAGSAIPSLRNNARVNLTDVARANDLWERARPHLPVAEDGRRPAGFHDALKIYRYQPDEFFDWHSDGIVRCEDGRTTAYTFLVYLDDDCDGGETSFYDRDATDGPQRFAVTPTTGTALGFVHRVLHRGETVTRGRKHVLRADVIYDE